MKQSEVERFWSKVERGPGCWLWGGTRFNTGYGQFKLGPPRRSPVRAHRYSYALVHGPIPEDTVIRHACDTPLCVNPDHLVAGTQADNIRDRVKRGRCSDRRGDKWDHRFLEVAALVASWSKDPSTQVGCLLVRDRRVLSTGYNGLPAQLSDLPERLSDRDLKLLYTIHAESNALLNSVTPVTGATAYVWPFPPCSDCAKLLVQAGILRVVCPPCPSFLERWGDSLALGRSMFAEAGVEYNERRYAR